MFEESSSEAWHLRYGEEAPSSLPDLGRLLNHRSVRDFADQPISDAILQALVAAAQSAATSSNLQLWSLISIQDPTRRKQIAELCADQDQIHKAGVFFAMVADNARLKTAAERVGEDPDGLDTAEFYTMAVVDAALAGERMTVAAEQLGLGCCYIGALRNHPKEAATLLGLPQSCFGLFGLAIGWPSEDCSAAIKPRLDQSTVWHKETYNRELDLSGYHDRMSAFYESQGMKGAVNWSMRSGRRAGLKRVGTRIEVKPFLTDQELDLR